MQKIRVCGASPVRTASMSGGSSWSTPNSSLVVFLGCLALGVGMGWGDPGDSDIVAQVGSSAITVQDFRAGVEKIRGEEISLAELDFPERLSVLDALLAARLLVLEAEKRGIDKEPAVVASLPSLERKLLKEAVYERYVWPLATVTDSALQAYYEEGGSGEELHVAHILCRTSEEAAEVLRQFAAGTSFEELVQERSRHIASVSTSGSMGFMRRNQLLPEIEEAIWSGTVGQVYPKPIRTRMGYHVVKLIERRYRSLEEQNAALTGRLKRTERMRVDALFKDQLKSDYELVWHPETAAHMARLEDRIPGDGILYSWRGGSLDLATYVRRASDPRAVSDDTAHTRSIAEELALDVLIAIEARKRGYDQIEEIRNKLEKNRLQLLSEVLYEQEVGDPPPSEVAEFYRANRDKYIGDTRITIREILVDEEALADSLYDWISAGQDMSDLAHRYSVRTDLQKTGGLWEEVARSDPRSGKIYRIALDSEGLQGPLKVPGGYSVFEVLEKRRGHQLSLEEVEEAVRGDMAALAMDSFIGDLRKRYAQRIRIDAEVLRAVE